MNNDERQPLLPGAGPHDDVSQRGKGSTRSEVDWRSETRLIAGQSLPLIFTYLLQYAYQAAIVVAASRLSTDELAAVSLGIMTSNIIGYAVLEGMAGALDTLCAQAYGAGRLELVGLHTVRFTLLMLAVCVPIGVLWALSPLILEHIIPEADLAANAGVFMRWSLIGLPGYAAFEAGKRFTQAQSDFTAGLLALIACLPVPIFLNWLLVWHLDLRIPGAALAAAVTNLVRPMFLLAYSAFYDKDTLQCWPKQLELRALFKNWSPMVRLALPAALMVMSEWFAYEILQISTSYVGKVDLAAQTFLGTGAMLCWHIPFAVSVATTTRLGQLIGGGSIEDGRRVSYYHLSMFAVVAFFNVGFEALVTELSVWYLTTDAAVRRAALLAMPFAMVFVFFDAMVTFLHGVVRGLGWQRLGSWVTLGVGYLFGVPLALLLELGPPMLGLRGLWIGLASGLAVTMVVEGLVVRARSWETVVEEAQARQQD